MQESRIMPARHLEAFGSTFHSQGKLLDHSLLLKNLNQVSDATESKQATKAIMFFGIVHLSLPFHLRK